MDRAARPLLATREKSPRKLVTLGTDPTQGISKITNIINSPRNNELRYADALGTRYRSHDDPHKAVNTIKTVTLQTGKVVGKENENLKKIKE